MNLGLGSGGSMIHTEMMQEFRPSGARSGRSRKGFFVGHSPIRRRQLAAEGAALFRPTLLVGLMASDSQSR